MWWRRLLLWPLVSRVNRRKRHAVREIEPLDMAGAYPVLIAVPEHRQHSILGTSLSRIGLLRYAATMLACPWITWRFSLRTLLIATTLVAVVLGIIVWMSRTG